MIKYQDYEKCFEKLKLLEEEGRAIIEYLAQIIDIAIEEYNERR